MPHREPSSGYEKQNEPFGNVKHLCGSHWKMKQKETIGRKKNHRTCGGAYCRTLRLASYTQSACVLRTYNCGWFCGILDLVLRFEKRKGKQRLKMLKLRCSIMLGVLLGARACDTDWDCSLGGSCGADRRCVCDPGWEGPTCARVAFKSAPSIGHAFRPGPGFTTWGGSPIQADNQSMYYLFASVQINGTLATYPNTSVIVTAVSSSPAGPYHWDRKTITIQARRPAGVRDQRAVTNPVVVRLRGGAGFVLFYVEQRSNSTDPYGTTGYSVIMAAFSASLDGPWEVREVLKPSTSPESSDNNVVCNPAAYVHPDNSITLAYRWYWENNGVGFAWAPSWRGSFQRLYGGSGQWVENPP